MKSLPKLSIVTPSFNQGEFIEDTIVSVLDQNYPNLEYIIIDGGSSDNSVEIIRKYEKFLAYWVSEKDRGQSHAINKGFEQASGDIYSWLNSDDRLEPGALSAVVDAFKKYPETGVFVGHGRKVDRSGNTQYYKKPDELTFEGICKWMDGGNFMQPSCFFRRSAWEKAGPLNENVHIALDVDLWLRMVKHVPFRAIDKLLSTAMIHEDAKTTALINRMTIDCALVVINAGGEKFVDKHLYRIADRLTDYEKLFETMSRNPIIRLIMRFYRNRKDTDL